MPEVNQDLVQQLEANRASFEAAGFAEDVKLIDAKLKDVKSGKVTSGPAYSQVEPGTAPAVAVVAEADAEDAGSGPFEGRTVAQLRSAAKAKGLATSGSKDELVERLRG